jgi:type I restriction enzyme, S subunit
VPKSGYNTVQWLFGKEIEIPEEWEIRMLNDVTKITRLAGYEYSNVWKHEPDGKIIALRGHNIQNNHLELTNTDNISEELSNKLSRSKLYKNDIVFPCVGTIGHAAVILENEKYHINQNIAKITPAKILYPLFLTFFLMSDFTIKQIFKYNASTSQPNVLVGNLRKFLILIPSLSEQQKIASILSNVDNLIDSYEKTIESTKKLKKGLMQTLLTKGIGHKEFKKISLEPKFVNTKIPKKWDLLELKNLLQQKISYGIILHTEVKNGFPMIISGNIDEPNGIKKNLKFVDPEIEKKYTKTRLQGGEVVMALVGATVGKVAIIPSWCKGYNVSRHLAVMRFKKQYFPNYFAYLLKLNLYQKKIFIQTIGSAQPVINLGQLSSFKIITPSKEEQQKIVSILSSVDNEITKLESKKKSAESLKKGLMQKLLTGQIRVTV